MILTLTLITFPLDGSVGNPDSSQFQMFAGPTSGFSFKIYKTFKTIYNLIMQT